MGYTHYWRQQRAFTDAEWAKLTADVRQLFNHMGSIAGGDGTGEPDVNDVEIRFNGTEPYDFETFTLPKAPNQHFDFCKTGCRPYDMVVCAVLILAQHHAPEAIAVSSDGEPEDWEPGLHLVRRVFERLDYRVPPGVRS